MSQQNVTLIDLSGDDDSTDVSVRQVEAVGTTNANVKSTGAIPKNQFWLKNQQMQLDSRDASEKRPSDLSSNVNTSTKEFLQKERMCSDEMHKSELKRDDTLCDLASVAFDKYSSDFENATDQDISIILEEISKIADMNGASAGLNQGKTPTSEKNSTDEERSVEELLEEAEKLVRKNSCTIAKTPLDTTINLDDMDDTAMAIERVNALEANIFQLIEQQVHKESEKLRTSPRSDKDRGSIEMIYENVSKLSLGHREAAPKEQKFDVSSNSDLDDPIEKHSRAEELNDADKDNLRKEITDVDENFFPDLMKRSIEKMEAGGLSGSSSFGQEEFSHFLKLLGGQSGEPVDLHKNAPYPEKEISEILNKELYLDLGGGKNQTETEEVIRVAKEDKLADATKVPSVDDELYEVNLTPRLELFADKIPKLMAEKSIEREENNRMTKSLTSELELCLTSKKCEVESRTGSAPELAKKRMKENPIGKSKSCDQLAKISTKSQPEKKAAGFQIKQPLMPSCSIKTRPPIVKARTQSRTKKTDGVAKSSISYLSKSQMKTNKIDESKKNLDKTEMEVLYNEEKHKNKLLKEQIEAEAQRYKAQMESMKVTFEQELFGLKKQNIILKAKSDDKVTVERRPENGKISLLEEELERQEKLIKAYEAENKKLIQDAKHYQNELKLLRQKPRNVGSTIENQRLQDQVKNLKEEKLKLSLEASELRQTNSDLSLKNEDLTQQCSLLKDELAMFKEQLSIKNNFITTRLQAMTTTELNLKRQMEDLKVELSSKTEQLKMIKLDYDKLQHGMIPVEKELIEMRAREENLLEKLQVSKSHVEREKQLTLKLKDQVILDNNKILDLTRQVKEMERIIKRKNPDSMAALLLSSNSEQEKAHAEKVKYYEDKIAVLEAEIRRQEEVARRQITDLQRRLDEANEKHAVRVSELQQQIMDLNFSNDRKMYTDGFTQTVPSQLDGKKSEERNGKTGSRMQSKEDTHLLATIRGLKLEVANKDKTVAKISKDLQELQKTTKRLQKEREKLLNERKNLTRSSSLHRMTEVNDHNSNYQNGGQRLSSSMQKLYDPVQFSENPMVNGDSSKRTFYENGALKEELLQVNKELVAMKNKRIQDLNMLQEEHENELADVVKAYSTKLAESKSQLNNQMVVINHLRDQLRKMQDFKDQAIVYKAERDHLETKIKSLSQKVKYLSATDTDQLQELQDKISILQQRHESRELTLQNLVRQLMRNRAQCRDCSGEQNKSSQLCYFRQELDQILGMLQEIAKNCSD